MLTGAPQVSSGEQLFLEQILMKNQCKKRLFTLYSDDGFSTRDANLWQWLRNDAENVQDGTEEINEVTEGERKSCGDTENIQDGFGRTNGVTEEERKSQVWK